MNNTLGDGFVEAIDDNTLNAIASQQAQRTNGAIHGEAVQVAIFEAPGQTRVGRFGWKATSTAACCRSWATLT